MTSLQFPDLEAALISGAKQDLQVEAGTSSPPVLEGTRFLRIQVVAGQDDTITDIALVDVDAFAADRPSARDLAEIVRVWLHDRPGHQVGGVLIDAVRTSIRPRWRSYGNPKIHRFVGSYWVSTRQAPVT